MSGFLKLNFLFWDNRRCICSFKKEYRELSPVPTQIAPVVTSCKTVWQYHGQDSDLDAVNTQNSPSTQGSLVLPTPL